MTQTVIVRTIGERWRSLDEAGKAEYKRRQEADKLRYEQELLTWSGDDLDLTGADSATAVDHSKALKNEEREEKKRKREAEKVRFLSLPWSALRGRLLKSVVVRGGRL